MREPLRQALNREPYRAQRSSLSATLRGVRAEAEPGQLLHDVWVYITPDEAFELLASLDVWAEEAQEGRLDPGWHMHITDSGREFTLAIDPDYGRGEQADPA